jgi:hypothetical protein
MRHQREPVIRGFSVFALTSILVAVVFVLTDHRRDLVGVTAGTNGPALITTIARLGLLGFTVTLVILWPQRPSLTRSPLTFAIGSYVLYIAAGVLWSPDPSFTLHKLVVLTTVGITAFCIAQVFDLDQITDLILVILVGYLVLGAAYEISSGSVQLRSDYRFEGTTSANQNGLFAAIVALISGTRLFLSHDSRSHRQRCGTRRPPWPSQGGPELLRRTQCHMGTTLGSGTRTPHPWLRPSGLLGKRPQRAS